MFETGKGWGYQVEEAVAGGEGPGVSAQWEEPLGLNLCQGLGLNSSSVWLLTNHQLSLSLVFSCIMEGSVRDKATWLVLVTALTLTSGLLSPGSLGSWVLCSPTHQQSSCLRGLCTDRSALGNALSPASYRGHSLASFWFLLQSPSQ